MASSPSTFAAPARARLPLALYALTAGSFGIGCAEFVIMGLLLQVAADLQVTIAAAGMLVSGYALGVFAGAPVLTLLTRRMPRKAVLLALMVIYTVGNAACALAPDYTTLMIARVLTSLTHGTFFGVGAVVATGLVPEDRRASAISVMFSGLTLATLLGMPAGAWLGLHLGWRSTFWAMTLVGLLSLAVIALLVQKSQDHGARVALRDELATIGRPQVLLGLLMTVLQSMGIFAVITYVQPLLTRVSGFGEAAVSPILLLFGAGMIVGNVLGGRFADRAPARAVLATLAALTVVLAAMTLAIHSQVLVVAFVGILGVAAFATVSPLQLRVLRHAHGAGENLASSFNIAAFNLGNGLGAWMGGVVVDHGPGLTALPWVAALAPMAALAVAWLSVKLEQGARNRAPMAQACP
ncbi:MULTISPECIES: MFS transporter [Cupriavidus]|uniref:Inner membrane transport protein YdhP n=1 Tax=Cupriavidus taiwanensis TaxID=164546 RepID=A0A976FXB0_9BURK|nr:MULTISPECIES: MFS transporter [Cupriavidus]MEC3764321.1 MFS transporter [Cupriavidus sp. SS-3]SOY93071.1 putative transporter, MFS family [Cupriavidus taiwanensis]SOY96682.1 putative transporter, MFS family [Cupriavidus taiwanensis]SPD68776.1 Inner membrane transport protein YdhP [Cupriavidus taiwanensis]